MEKILIVCYPKCSTCKKAEKFLKEKDIEYSYRDIKEENPTLEELKNWHEMSGLPLKKFFNTSGQLYRSMELKDKLKNMTDEEQYKLLSTDGMLVKRPILIKGSKVLVGFKVDEWEEI
ncbi:MAG: arsenate reductase family protein [Peptoniphilus sp.]|uniref:arsenate reductase family protein n=1 Tax=Peptoniphilus sp. TaxID=1971214 RepID=UPI002A75BB6C|nr:arsenate reductase family protein [Peptoniphilus sp.]MDY2987749.1 arsenate reductase family protein [Peptoniphilus sp.]